MNEKTMAQVEVEARELLRRIAAVRAANPDRFPIVGTPETGALRRQSMELTRALARLRKPL